MADLCCGHGLVGILFCHVRTQGQTRCTAGQGSARQFSGCTQHGDRNRTVGFATKSNTLFRPWKKHIIISRRAQTLLVFMLAEIERTNASTLPSRCEGPLPFYHVADIIARTHHHPVSKQCLAAMSRSTLIERTVCTTRAITFVWDQIPVGITEMNRVLIGIWKVRGATCDRSRSGFSLE